MSLGKPDLARRLGLALVILGVLASSLGVAAVASADQAIRVEMSEYKYSPAPINARAGEKVVFTLPNIGPRWPHNMRIEGHGVNVTSSNAQPGQTATLEVTFTAAGTYQVWCTLPGHRQQSMETTLVVAAAGASGLPRTGEPFVLSLLGLVAGAGLAGTGLILRRRG